MKRPAFALALILIFAAVPVRAQTYAEGQVWEYRTRPGEEGSLLKIDKIETIEKLGQVFHISVVGLKVVVPQRTDVRLTELPHIPVSRQTLDQSVTKLSKTPLKGPDFSKGYAAWRKSIDEGRAGVFTISVASIVGSVEESLKQNAPGPSAPRRSR
jgi:hypothetical protein